MSRRLERHTRRPAAPLHRAAVLVAAAALVAVGSCTREIAGPGGPAGLEYTVAIPAMGIDTIPVTLRIRSWPYGDSVRLLAPPVYADNPPLRSDRTNVHDFSVVSDDRDTVAAALCSVSVAADSVLSAVFAVARLPATVTWKVTMSYADSSGNPVPFVNNDAGYLQGNSLFDGGDHDLIPLVYTKGAQVCMLMDRLIRDSSEGATALDAVTGKLTQLFDGSAFSRQELLALIARESGADVSGIFAAYVDSPRTIPADTLAENYAALAAMGAFDGPAAAKQGVTAGSGRSLVKW